MTTTSRSLAMLLLGVLVSQAGAAWHQVFVPVDDKADLLRLRAALGGALDPCGTVIGERGVELPLEDGELAQVAAAGLLPQVIQADLEDFYAARAGADRNYGAYHTYSEGMAEIQALHADFPEIVGEPVSIGSTVQGNTIWAFKVSDNPGLDEDEPEVLYGAYIHAREAITIEVLLHFLHHLTDNYGSDPRVSAIVDGRELWFVPFMNPDGVLHNESTNPGGGGMWRKNRRVNGDGSFGVDLNRNFGFQWGFDNQGSSPTPSSDTYRGPAAFSEPETQAFRAFVNAHAFGAMLSYHSYSNLMIYPYGYTDIQCEEPWRTGYLALTGAMSENNAYACGTSWELLYNTNGDAVDWGHGATGEHARIVSLTTEVGTSTDGFWPLESRIPALVEENLESNLLFAEHGGNPWAFQPPARPVLSAPGAAGSTYTVSWSTPAPDPANPAVSYELRELSGYSSGSEPFSTTINWTAGPAAFTTTTARYTSAPRSFWGGTGNNRNAWSRLEAPFTVTAGMQVSLRAWYAIESGYDYAYVEVSENGTTWTPLAGSITTTDNPYGYNDGNGITGSSSNWVTATFPLAAWVGHTVQLRLRYETDGGVLGEGIYVDDLSPLITFANETVVGAALTGTSHTFHGHAPGQWWYKLRACDAQGDLSLWSNLVDVTVSGEDLEGPQIVVTPLQDTTDDLGPWTVTAALYDASGVGPVWLDHRRAGDNVWQSVAMAPMGGDLWQGAIPGPLSAPTTVEYRVRAEDLAAQPHGSASEVLQFHLRLPVGLSVCQDFTAGLGGFEVQTLEPAGNGWTLGSYSGQDQTAYIQYSGSAVDHSLLLSPVYNCANQRNVRLDFWHLLRMNYAGAWTNAYLRGSIDGGATWPYLLGAWEAAGVGEEVVVSGPASLDLPWADGQAAVRLAFDYSDQNDWFWHVDDVCLSGTLAFPATVELDLHMQNGNAFLSWSPVDAAAYRIYRAQQAAGPYAYLGTTASSAWTDPAALSLGEAFYQVRAWRPSAVALDPAVIPVLDPQDGRVVAGPLGK